MDNRLFICFASEDRYRITEPIVYHLKNYGINIWYDRYSLVMGDHRIKKNLIDGAMKCKYVIAIISEYTAASKCAMEELSIIKDRYYEGSVTIFPVLYEISPDNLSTNLLWVKELIFKEVNRHSGTYEVCNHIACKITSDILQAYKYQNIQTITSFLADIIPTATYNILINYHEIDSANLNSKVALLYSAYITIKVLIKPTDSSLNVMIFKIFERLFSETKLNLTIDYRELWLLENSICILINLYLIYCSESKI